MTSTLRYVGASGVRMGKPTPATINAAGTVEAFVEHRGLSPHHFPKRPKSVVRKVQHGI